METERTTAVCLFVGWLVVLFCCLCVVVVVVSFGGVGRWRGGGGYCW